MALSGIKCRTLKATGKHFDRDGLYLHVKQLSDGSLGKYWRYDYRFIKDGTHKGQIASFGKYPLVSLVEARELCRQAHKELAAGISPNQSKRQKKLNKLKARTFASVAAEWMEKREKQMERGTLAPATLKKDRLLLENHVNKTIGNMAIKDIEPIHILHMLQSLERAEKYEALKKVKSVTRLVFRYAVGLQLVPREVVSDVSTGFITPERKGFAFIQEPERIGQLLRDIEGYQGDTFTKLSLQFLMYTFVRPGELRFMAWDEIDWERREWHIAEDRIKQRKDHIVPLAEQPLAILEIMKEHRRSLPFVFYSLRSQKKVLSEGTYNKALRTLGYGTDDIVAHGFRKVASTRLHAMRKYQSEWIEAQLSHADRNQVRAVYNKYDYLPERADMMQDWADYLDSLSTKG